MNISYNKFMMVIMLFSLLLMVGIKRLEAQHRPVWPINPNDDPANWNRVNCTFGEVHSRGTKIHGAIDIDVVNNAPGRPVRAAQPGRREIAAVNIPGFHGVAIELMHEYPPGSGVYNRRTRYLHVDANQPIIPLMQEVGTGEQIARVDTQDGHLHFEMQEKINGEWVRLDPLDNDSAWNLRYHQHLEGQPDTYDPQINDILIEANTGCTAAPLQAGQACPQNNSVASGVNISATTGGLVAFNAGMPPKRYVRAHLADVAPATNNASNCNYPILGAAWNGTRYDAAADRLVVYGNIGMTARVRDVAINSNPGDNQSSGCGLTIRQLDYRIENEHENIHVPSKYPLAFDRLREAERSSVSQIFGTATFDAAHLTFGNNDFIELRSGDDDYLSPYPNKQIEFENLQGQQVQEQSNGIWSTKARADTEHIFRYTPDNQHIARCNAPGEAKYPDGDYTLKFFAQDDWGRVNRAVNAADVNAKVTVIVDNFKPFVKKVEIVSGEQMIYSGAWSWTFRLQTGTEQLNLTRPTQLKADLRQSLQIIVTTSEPMTVTTGALTGSVRITLAASLNGNEQNWLEDLSPYAVSDDRTTWTFFVPASAFAGRAADETQIIHITGADLAGNALLPYNGDASTYPEDQIPRRMQATPALWEQMPSTGLGSEQDGDTTHRFQFTPRQTFAATYGGDWDEIAYALDRTDTGAIVAAGFTTSFGNGGADIWALKLDAAGNVSWAKTYGESGVDEQAYAIQQTTEGGYLVVGNKHLADGNVRVWILKLASDGALQWHQTLGGNLTVASEECLLQTADGYVIVGKTAAAPSDAFVAKLDAQGNVTWQSAYGRNGNDAAYAVQPEDGGYVVAGSTQNDWQCQNQRTVTSDDVLLFHVDANGALDWQARYGGIGPVCCNLACNEEARSLELASNGDYVVIDQTDVIYQTGGQNLETLLLKIGAATHTVVTAETYGTDKDDWIHAAQRMEDGHYAAAGATRSYNDATPVCSLFKINQDSDKMMFKRIYGVPAFEEAYAVRESANGGLLLTGVANASALNVKKKELLLLNVDATGFLGEGGKFSRPGFFEKGVNFTMASVTNISPPNPLSDFTRTEAPDVSPPVSCALPEHLCDPLVKVTTSMNSQMIYPDKTQKLAVQQGRAGSDIAAGGVYDFPPVPVAAQPTLTADGVTTTAVTDAAGSYELFVPEGWSGTVTLALADYVFSPPSLSLTNVTSNQTVTAIFGKL